MPFLLDDVVPWGRNIDEYREMFLLDDKDKDKETEYEFQKGANKLLQIRR